MRRGFKNTNPSLNLKKHKLNTRKTESEARFCLSERWSLGKLCYSTESLLCLSVCVCVWVTTSFFFWARPVRACALMSAPSQTPAPHLLLPAGRGGTAASTYWTSVVQIHTVMNCKDRHVLLDTSHSYTYIHTPKLYLSKSTNTAL